MSPEHDAFENEFAEWKRSRAAGDAPAGFVDRVMAAVAAEPPTPRERVRRILAALDASPLGRAAALTAAGVLVLARIVALFSVFAMR